MAIAGFLLCAAADALAVERDPMPEELARNYQGAYFADPLHGYAFGEAIIATDDGGTTWRVVRDQVSLASIVFLSNSMFRALDGAGNLLVSDDGGGTVAVSAPRFRDGESGDLLPICGHLFFVDASKGWSICGRNVLATVDGGQIWVSYELPHALGEPRLIHMFDAAQGIATRPFDAVLQTSTSGATWTAVSNAPSLELVSCLASGFCAGVGGRNGPVFVSTDHGASWNDANAPLQLPDRDEIRAIQAVAPNLVLAAGSDLGSSYLQDVKPLLDAGQPVPAMPHPRALLLKWNGAAWSRTTYDDPRRLVGLSFSDASNGWLVGIGENELFKTTDAGQTLQFVPDYFRQLAALTPSPTPFATPVPTP